MSFDFVAIDFETANKNNNSACSMGLAAVKDLSIVETKYFLIHPPTLDFDESNIKIHGITPSMVKDSPKFPDIWDQIRHYFDENVIVAHNAQFDMSVLNCCLYDYHLDAADFTYICSIPISTKACRGEGVGQSLAARAEHFGIEMGNHHNALDDAVTCANIVIETVKHTKRKSFQSFCRVFSSLPIKQFSELHPQSKFINKRAHKFQRICVSEITAATYEFDTKHEFYGKTFVFTGELESMERKDAMQKVVDLGAVIKSAVSSKTNYLVVGAQDKTLVGDDGLSSKEEKAYELIERGYDIKVLTEDEFLSML